MLKGDSGNDTIFGGAGKDTIYGGKGVDKLHGSDGNDTIVFLSASETGVGNNKRDIIDVSAKDWNNKAHRDTIDLSAIDANEKKSGNQKFEFIGEHQFNKTAGELRYTKILTGDPDDRATVLQGDTDGNGEVDFEIEWSSVVDLVRSDFDL